MFGWTESETGCVWGARGWEERGGLRGVPEEGNRITQAADQMMESVKRRSNIFSERLADEWQTLHDDDQESAARGPQRSDKRCCPPGPCYLDEKWQRLSVFRPECLGWLRWCPKGPHFTFDMRAPRA